MKPDLLHACLDHLAELPFAEAVDRPDVEHGRRPTDAMFALRLADGWRREFIVALQRVDGLYAYAVSIDPQLREPDGRDYVRESHVRVVDVATGQVIREARPSARLIGFAHPYR